MRNIQQQQHHETQYHKRHDNARFRNHFFLGRVPVGDGGGMVAWWQRVVRVWELGVAEGEDAGEAGGGFLGFFGAKGVGGGRHRGCVRAWLG